MVIAPPKKKLGNTEGVPKVTTDKSHASAGTATTNPTTRVKAASHNGSRKYSNGAARDSPARSRTTVDLDRFRSGRLSLAQKLERATGRVGSQRERRENPRLG
jgi:hypothetical protein